MSENRKMKLDEIYRAHAGPLFYFLKKLSGSAEVAEDLVQDTFLKATVSLEFYKEEEVRGWLFRTARHAYYDHWRKRKRWQWLPFLEKVHKDIHNPYGTPESEAVVKESRQDVDELYGRLPENYRTILYLREHEDFSYEQLARTLEMTESQVKVTLHRARKKFKKLARAYHIRDFEEGETTDDGKLD